MTIVVVPAGPSGCNSLLYKFLLPTSHHCAAAQSILASPHTPFLLIIGNSVGPPTIDTFSFFHLSFFSFSLHMFTILLYSHVLELMSILCVISCIMLLLLCTWVLTMSLYINEMINNKIKMLELEKYKITLNELEIDRRVNSLIDKDNLVDLKQRLKEKISTDNKWNNLIYLKFRNKLEINMQEINEKFSNNQNQEKKNQIIENEKKKKLNIISKTYFNEIKKNYLVKKL